MPYALASGLLPAGAARARRRSATCARTARACSGSSAPAPTRSTAATRRFPVSGTDEVYGINTARFLAAAAARREQLVLSLYGQLAAGMTPDTFVAGEAATVAPLARRADRSMYLPPNGAANGAFLETLRLLLVHETRRRRSSSPARRRAPGSRRQAIAVRRAADELRARLVRDRRRHA